MFVLTIQYLSHRVEFQDVHRLSDGQVKHSPEVFYAGSLWKVRNNLQLILFLKYYLLNVMISLHGTPSKGGKLTSWFYYIVQVSVQAFNDEDPQGRRTLGNLPTT